MNWSNWNQWADWADFASMGGYGFYVWGSLGMCAAVLVAEVLMLKARRRALQNEFETDDGDSVGTEAHNANPQRWNGQGGAA